MTRKTVPYRALLQMLLIAALACSSMEAFAVVGVDWTLRNPSQSSESWNGVARNGDARHATSVLVAVGGHGRIVSATTAAGPWTTCVSGTTEDLNAVTWSPSAALNTDSLMGLFVAVGNKGVVLTSANGTTWTRLAGVNFADPAKPASPPGNQLQSDATLATQDFVSVCWTSAKFFIGGNTAAGPVVYVADNGVAWQKYPAVGAGLKLKSITGSLSSKVVVVTDKNVLSAQANAPSVWTAPVAFPAGETALQNMIFYSNNTNTIANFIVSGIHAYTAQSVGSWVMQTLPDSYLNLTLNISQGGIKIIGAGASGTVWTSPFGSVWTALPTVPEPGVKLRGAVDFGSEYVAVGDGGRIYRYAAGAWTSVYSAGAVDDLAAVAINGTALVAVGRNVSLVSTDNGVNWTRNAPAIDATSVIGLGGAGFLATGTGIWTSTDGAAWTPSATTFTGRLNRLVALPAAGRFIAVGADTSAATLASMIYTYDGGVATWTKATLPAGSAKELRGAAASSDLTVVVGDGGLVLTSTDGAVWTKRAAVLAAGENFTEVLFTGTQFIAGTSIGGTWTSTDGVAWTKRQASGTAGISRLVRAVINPNSLVVGVGGAGMTTKSYGGVYWYGGNAGTSQSLKDALWTGSQIIAVGTNGTVFSSSGPITPQPQVQFAVDHSSVLESAGTATVVVQMSSPAPLPVTVTFTGSTSTKISTDLATLGTTAASDYGLPVPASLTFNPGANGSPGETSKSINLTIRQDNIDELDERVLLTLLAPTGDAVLGGTVLHTLTITDDDTKPFVATPADQPQHQLVNVGDALVVHANGGGVAQPAGQWKKNAVNVTTGASVTGMSYNLAFASATIAQAGAYTLLLTNPSGTKLSDAAQIGVVDNTPKSLVAAENSTVTFSVSAAGTGLSYQWQRANNGGTPSNLVDDISAAKHITGAKTAKLTVKKVAMNEADVYSCVVTQTTAVGTPVGTRTRTGGTTTLSVVNAIPVVTAPVFTGMNSANRVVGESFASVLAPTATNLPYKWSVTGLPLGLTYSTVTGKISGQSQKIGTFQITFIATNAVGASTKVTVPLTVAGLPGGVAGTFMGLGLPNLVADRSLGTRLDLTITDVAAFSGKLLHGTLATSFTGTLLYTATGGSPIITGTVALKPVGFAAVTLNINVHPSASPAAPNTISVQLVDAAAGSITFNAWPKNWLSVDPTKWFIDPTSLKAVYNFGINPGSTLPGGALDLTIPNGYSTASFTLAGDGSVATAGHMGDGTSFTSSGFINATTVTDANTDIASVIQVPVYSGLYSNVGAINGLMNLTPNAVSDGITPGEWNALTGTRVFYYTLKASKKSDTEPGVLKTLNTSVTYPSGRYTPPHTGERVLDAAAAPGQNNMVIQFRDGGLNTTDRGTNPPTVTWNVTRRPDADFVVGSPDLISGLSTSAFTDLKITAATGAFKGSFLLSDPQPGVGTQPMVPRTVNYEGLILGHRGVPQNARNDYMIGFGSFTLAPLPGTLQVNTWGGAYIQRLR